MWRKTLVACIATLCSFTATGASADSFTLRMGGGHTTGTTYIDVFDKFFAKEVARRVKEETGHTIRFIKAWGGSVAKVDGGIEAAQRGTLDIALSPIGFEQSRAALLNYSAYVPFTTPDPVLQYRVAERMLAEVPELQESLDAYNVHILASMVTEAYGIATTFPWTEIDQLAGKRIAMAATNAPLFLPINGVPINLGIGEHYQAMQTRLADGSLFWISGMEAFRLKEVSKYFVKTDFGSLSTLAAFMNKDTRQRLPEEVVAIIDEVAREAALIVAEKSKERDIAVEQALVAEGVTVHQLSEDEKRKWATTLIDLPARAAKDLEQRNLPGTKVLSEYVRILGEEGYRFPVDYTF